MAKSQMPSRSLSHTAIIVLSIVACFSCHVSALIAPAPKPLSVFSVSPDNRLTVESLKSQILQLGASLDRGQAYNPTSGTYYADRMAVAR